MKKKANYLSLASVISAWAVVTLHSNGCFWEFSKTADYWPSANFIECLCYFSVPVFFMISGTTLIDYRNRYDTRTYFKKRIKKTLIPYLCWIAIGIVFQLVYLNTIQMNDLSFQFIVNAVLTGKFGIFEIYWFFIPLFCVYLFIPILSAIDNRKRDLIILYIAIVGTIIFCFLPFLDGILKTNISISSFSNIGNYNFIIYVCIGYLISHKDIPFSNRVIIYILGICGFLMHYFGTYYESMAIGEISKIYKGFVNFPSLLYSTAFFTLFRYGGINILKIGFIEKLIRFLQNYTFPCYLMHRFFLYIILYGFHANQYAMIYRLGAPFLVFILSVVVTMILRKIPILKHIVP